MCTLKGGSGNSVQYSSAEQVSKLLGKRGELASMYLCNLSVQPSKEKHRVVFSARVGEAPKELEELQSLVAKHEGIFQEPQGLPPNREVNHRIPLKEGQSIINQKPYRYPAPQKDIIEKMVKEMLSMGIIRSSSSLFSFPVVLVKKKDQT